MAIEKFISIKEVISKIYRDLDVQQESRWMDMIEWCAEALQKIGAYPQYVPKRADFEVENFRTALPCDLYKITQLSYNSNALEELSGTFEMSEQNYENLRTENRFGYKIADGYIHTNFKEGTVSMSYIAIPTDKEGFPVIPDNESYKEALEKYVIMKLKYPEFLTGKLNPNIYLKIETDWHRYCAQARGSANMPTLGEMESIKNQWVRLLPQLDRYSGFFKNASNSEAIVKGKRYN